MPRKRRPGRHRSHLPRRMRAAAIDRFGPPSKLTTRERKLPQLGPSEVLIAVHTAGVASWDGAIREGSWRPPGKPKFPMVLGTDGAGIVVAKGSRVRRLRVGDRVYGYEFGSSKGDSTRSMQRSRLGMSHACRNASAWLKRELPRQPG
jgi:NADPH:quinone reductase